jgi:anaerobic dimethyl sulfoxide reductase subunit B (iron-sulfur subunit)
MAQLGFYHNTDECVSCKACVIACKDKNDLPLGEKMRKVYDYAKCEWTVDAQGVCTPSEDRYAYSVSMSCNHCVTPACMAVCPVEAIIKREEDGVVYIDEALCIGCSSCITACPFSAPYLSTVTSKVKKCDFCRDLIDEGETPQCVAACSTRCLQFGDIVELRDEYKGKDTVPPITDDISTSPSVLFTPSRLHPNAEPDGVLTSPEEEITSATV